MRNAIGEKGSRERIGAVMGAPLRPSETALPVTREPGLSSTRSTLEQFTPIAEALQRGGHGSCAVVTCYWQGNQSLTLEEPIDDNIDGGHAFNMVNHRGTIYIVDPQTGESWSGQAVTGWFGVGRARAVEAVVWDPKGRPIPW
jgi:hypothetical protein